MKPIVKDLAQCTRNWAEKTRDRVCAPSNLMGMCAIASAHLHRVLADAGVKTVIAANNGHVFLLLNGCVLDITATQFSREVGDDGYPAVFYRRHSLILSGCTEYRTRLWDSHWHALHKFTTVEELNLWQRNWSSNQQAVHNWDPIFIKNPWMYF
jgi:hypothetical protein